MCLPDDADVAFYEADAPLIGPGGQHPFAVHWGQIGTGGVCAVLPGTGERMSGHSVIETVPA